MGIVDRNSQDDDGALGSSGLHLDLNTKACPECRQEVMPWDTACPDCGVATVDSTNLPAASFELPSLAFDDEADDGSDDKSGNDQARDD